MQESELMKIYKKLCSANNEGVFRGQRTLLPLFHCMVLVVSIWASSGQEVRGLENGMTQSTGGKQAQAEDYHTWLHLTIIMSEHQDLPK